MLKKNLIQQNMLKINGKTKATMRFQSKNGTTIVTFNGSAPTRIYGENLDESI